MKQKLGIGMVITALFFFSITTVSAQQEKFQSMFIYNFGKYIQWPENGIAGKFVIGVYEDDAIYSALNSMVGSKKQIQGHDIEIVKIKYTADAPRCHIVFIPSESKISMEELVRYTATSPTLIVTEKRGMTTQGSMINFIEEDGKMKFELNKAKVESKGMKVSSSLLTLAVIV